MCLLWQERYCLLLGLWRWNNPFFFCLIWTQTDQTTLGSCADVALMKGFPIWAKDKRRHTEYRMVDSDHQLIRKGRLILKLYDSWLVKQAVLVKMWNTNMTSNICPNSESNRLITDCEVYIKVASDSPPLRSLIGMRKKRQKNLTQNIRERAELRLCS